MLHLLWTSSLLLDIYIWHGDRLSLDPMLGENLDDIVNTLSSSGSAAYLAGALFRLLTSIWVLEGRLASANDVALHSLHQH
jgi:hypothetical protein